MPEFAERCRLYPAGSLALARWRLDYSPGQKLSWRPYDGAVQIGNTQARPTLLAPGAVLPGAATFMISPRTVDGLYAGPSIQLTDVTLRFTDGDRWVQYALTGNDNDFIRLTSETTTFQSRAIPLTEYEAISYRPTAVVRSTSPGLASDVRLTDSIMTVVTPDDGVDLWCDPLEGDAAVAREDVPTLEAASLADESATLHMRVTPVTANASVRWRGKIWRVASVREDLRDYVDLELLRTVRAGA